MAAVGVAQQDALEVAQQDEAVFFLANIQWPLAQLLSRRLEDARARVRSNFMWMWFGCLGGGWQGQDDPRTAVRAEFKRVISINLKNKSEFAQSRRPKAGMKKPGRVASGLCRSNAHLKLGSAFLEGLHFFVGADGGHLLADELVSASDGSSQGELDVFAVSFDHDGLGVSVNGLELAAGGFSFAAACEGGHREAEDGKGGDDGFHVKLEGG